jgi:FlaA1/EpsC-like NDP-sugar epimerase
LAEAIGPECKREIVGIRPGEKIHEEMITGSDSFYTADVDRYYVILPQSPAWSYDEYFVKRKAKRVADGFTYNSGSNEEWLTKEQIRDLIRLQIDPNFAV